MAENKANSVFYPVNKKNIKTAKFSFGLPTDKYKGVFISKSATGNGKAKLSFKKGRVILKQRGIPVREFIPFTDLEALVFDPAQYVQDLVKHFRKDSVFTPYSKHGYLLSAYSGDKESIPEIVLGLMFEYTTKDSAATDWLAGLRIVSRKGLK